MGHEPATPGNPAPGQEHPYVHETSDREQRRLARRTAATSAAFLLPHLRPGLRLLDCGCGVGSITLGLAEAVAPGEVVGVDFQAAQVARAQALAAERGVTNVRFEVASVYALPFPDGSFDAVFANTLLLHLAEPLHALREMRRVLRPGGVVAVADDDHSTQIWEPRTPLMTAMHQLFVKVIAHHGGDGYRARHHRRLLLEAGFARPVATGTLGTAGACGTPEDTRLYAAWVVEQAAAPAFRALVAAQGWADEATLAAMTADTLAWGERPDALMSFTGVAALGWVEEPT
jgi:ubiquinone/menaquinone biosynthesis C-methylase UbiE